MIAQKEETLKAQRDADSSKLEEYTEAFKGLGVEVINIKCEREIKHVTDRINYVLKPYIEDRISRW
jgi:predicted ATPase